MLFFIEFLFRIIESIKGRIEKLRVKVFLQIPHNDFKVVGHIHIINRNVSIGRNVVLYQDVMFWGDAPIIIGNGVSVGAQTVIYAKERVEIGDNTQVAAQCYIIDMDHGIAATELISKQKLSVDPVIIGKDCWLGANVTVLKGSVIEDGAIVGAKGLVKGHIPQNAIAVGVPAKIVKYRE